MVEKRKATVFDLDGVVFERIPIQQKALLHAIPRLIAQRPVIDSFPMFPSQIPDPIDRTPKDKPLSSVWEEIILKQRRGRDICLDAPSLIIQSSQTSDVYGNTGRSNKKVWVDMTKESLEKVGLLRYFTDIAFRPEGYTTIESKLEKILRLKERYDEIDYYDDNPADALPIAALFPTVQVKIVQDLSTGILFSKVELDRFPNVERIALRRRPILYYVKQFLKKA